MTGEVKVFISGGCVIDVKAPKGVKVTVIDYDTDGVPDDELDTDGKSPCLVSVWT